MTLNVFLSGKIDREHGAWRDELLGTDYDYPSASRRSRWNLRAEEAGRDGCDDDAPPSWPQEPNRWVLGLHNYVGPYCIDVQETDSKYLGCFHGTTWNGAHGVMGPEDRRRVTQSCLTAIRRADLVFAYINTPDCYGTLVELGYARAMGVYAHVLIEDSAGWDGDDYWFAEQVASSAEWRMPDDRPLSIADAFKDALVQFTAAPPRPAPTALPVGIGESFSNIARWTADPRVRFEAQRMLKALGR